MNRDDLIDWLEKLEWVLWKAAELSELVEDLRADVLEQTPDPPAPDVGQEERERCLELCRRWGKDPDLDTALVFDYREEGYVRFRALKDRGRGDVCFERSVPVGDLDWRYWYETLKANFLEQRSENR